MLPLEPRPVEDPEPEPPPPPPPPPKGELLKLSKSLGYRNYLYYISTSDPSINVSRVNNRVSFKGHDVPEDKIISR